MINMIRGATLGEPVMGASVKKILSVLPESGMEVAYNRRLYLLLPAPCFTIKLIMFAQMERQW
jgi:hypothetical protein